MSRATALPEPVGTARTSIHRGTLASSSWSRPWAAAATSMSGRVP